MHDRRKSPVFLLALLLAAPALIAAEPIPKVLDQAKLDRFLAEVDLLTADQDIAAAWNSAGSAAAQEVVIDPNANFASGCISSSANPQKNRAEFPIKAWVILPGFSAA